MLQQYYAFVFSSSSAQLCAVTLAQQVLSVSTKAAGRASKGGGASVLTRHKSPVCFKKLQNDPRSTANISEHRRTGLGRLSDGESIYESKLGTNG